jgi:hypothetical protein
MIHLFSRGMLSFSIPLGNDRKSDYRVLLNMNVMVALPGRTPRHYARAPHVSGPNELRAYAEIHGGPVFGWYRGPFLGDC